MLYKREAYANRWSGFDTYVWSAGDGHDTILDSDGSGQISYEGRVLSGGAQNDSRVYTDASGTRYEMVAGAGGSQRLVIDGAISVENFTSGNLGIVLQGDSMDPSRGCREFLTPIKAVLSENGSQASMQAILVGG